MRYLVKSVLYAIVCSCAHAQNYDIYTLTGRGVPTNVPATSVRIPQSGGVAVDAGGNVYFAATWGNVVYRIDATTGNLTLVAGSGVAGYSGDEGPAQKARLNYPTGVAIDAAGDIYIADTYNQVIRRVSAGVITTFAGNGSFGYSGDGGPATTAKLRGPRGVAVDLSGRLYIADTGNDVIRMVAGGVIATIAGNGTQGYSGDNGPATNATLDQPSGIALDPGGNLYISDQFGKIRRITGGIITTIGSLSVEAPAADNILGLGADGIGNVYVSETASHQVVQIANGAISRFAGSGNGCAGGTASYVPANTTNVCFPTGVAASVGGNVYIVQLEGSSGPALVTMVQEGILTVIAGGGPPYLGDNGPAIEGALNEPAGIAVDTAGNLFIADPGNCAVRKVSKGIITTFAGNGTCGYSGDFGPATSAQLSDPYGVAVDADDSVYIADLGGVIRKVTHGVITTVAGVFLGELGCGYSGDGGRATNAELCRPYGVAVDDNGNIYIADSGNNVIRKVSKGIISTFAGNGSGAMGLGLGCYFDCYGGDNGPAINAELAGPLGVAVGPDGSLYISDSANNVIRKVTNGIITNVAGSKFGGNSSGGCNGGYYGNNVPANGASLNVPVGLAVDADGNVYFADSCNSVVRKVSNGVITTIAGTGQEGYSGDDGPAVQAELTGPWGVAVGPKAEIYIGDQGAGVIRVLRVPEHRNAIEPLPLPRGPLSLLPSPAVVRHRLEPKARQH